MKKFLLTFVSVLLISLIAFSQVAAAAPSGDVPPEDQGDTAKRTILLYICGSNLESGFANATYNLEQVLSASFSADEDVRCLVMTGGSEEWHMESDYLRDPNGVGITVDPYLDEYTVSAEYNQLWEAKGADAPEDPGTLTLLDADGITGAPGEAVLSEDELMTDPEVLKAFINYGVENFPAEKYDLILWDHGGGPVGGYGNDEHDYFSYMAFPDIIDALSDNLVVDADGDGELDGKFDFIDFDACLMSSVELSFALADYTDYYVASPETEPGYGQEYSGWFNHLGEDPDCDTFELGKIIVDDFMEFYTTGEGEGDYGTLSVIDLKKLTAPETGFVEAVSDLQAILQAQIETKSDAGEYLFYDELASVRDAIHYNDDAFIDLGNLASFLSIATLEYTDEEDIYFTNAYTEVSERIMSILEQGEENDVIYARGSDEIETGFVIYRDASGDIQLGTMHTSGIYICFPLMDPNFSFIEEYYEAMSGVLEQMPESDRKDFLTAYLDTTVDYALIRCTGAAVNRLINAKGVDKSEINFDRVYEYWSEVPAYYPDDSYSEWNRMVKNLFEMKQGGLSGENKAWIDEVIRQQAGEAITTDDVTVDRIHYDYGDEYILHLNGVNDRVVQCAEREIIAELPALEDYIQQYHKDDRAFYDYLGLLQIGTAYGALSDSDESGQNSSWWLSSFEQKWLAVNDADGVNHVTAVHKGTVNGIQIPVYYGSIESPSTALLEFRFDEGSEDDNELYLDTIWFRTSQGSVRGTKVKDLTDELTVCPIILAATYYREYCLPISESSFTISKDNYSSIKLCYTDISDIPDIRDIDGDGRAFYSIVTVKDIYDNMIDVTDNVNEPDRELTYIGLAEIRPATATGDELTPVVEYNGQVLREGVDYTWKKRNPDDAISAPGTYTVILTGKGTFTGEKQLVFTVGSPLMGDADLDGEVTILDATVIQRVLAKLDVERYNMYAADVDGDGEVTILDATAIQRWLAHLPSPLSIKDNDEIYAAAVRDAVFIDEDEVLPLVNISKDDDRVIWDGDKVLVLFMHKYPDSYPAGEDIELQWGNVWCVSAGEAHQWVEENGAGVNDWTERMHQLLGMPTSKEYTTITALWVDASLLYRPANVTDPNSPMSATYQKTGDEAFDAMYKKWFDSNIIWSYFDSAYPWTRLGYTYDWADDGVDYGLSEFIIFSGAQATVAYTYTVDEFVAYVNQL